MQRIYSKKLIFEKGDSAPLNELRLLTLQESDIVQKIREYFPINQYGNLDDLLLIKGSKMLLTELENINNLSKKMDISMPLSDIEYIGLSDNNELILRFISDDITATGTYKFKEDFLEIFKLSSFGNYCIRNGHRDILQENLAKLLTRLGKEKKQFRLLFHNEKFILRGLTSEHYNNYDNNLLLYTVFLELHKFSKEENVNFYIDKAYISDSDINISLEQEQVIPLDNIGNVQLGIQLINNEIRDSAVSIQLRYKVSDNEGNAFIGVSTLKDSLINFNHIAKFDTAISKIKSISNLKEAEFEVLEFIRNIHDTPELTINSLYEVMKKVVNSKKTFSTETRTQAEKVYNDLRDNTVSLIKAFGRMGEISDNVDETTIIERILHEVLWEQTKSNKVITNSNFQ
ncbi:hypothetical protein [Peribacillus sp. SI8-4]|uniref:hypothetical protein n=1 Tax=Peribacillus sp. SI8-4 TaxID=3048009 RepID=UPI0025579981|nr:hypothetical protein [Peribacillus sp. SI8-4]